MHLKCINIIFLDSYFDVTVMHQCLTCNKCNASIWIMIPTIKCAVTLHNYYYYYYY